MRCRATVLVNLRPALGVQAVAEMIEKNAIVIQGNCFGFVIIPLNIAQLQNPLDYVHKAKISMDRKKRSLESVNAPSTCYNFSSSSLALRVQQNLLEEFHLKQH